MRHGVLLRRHGMLVRVPLAQPVVHVSWYEADAWCRWAGRRLPAEAEWEAAALQGASRGFRWGDVREWTAGTLRAYPGYPGPSPGQADGALSGIARVLRGAAFATAPRLRHPRARAGCPPDHDEGFCGFRSCAL
jgi:formylglycine-generating enzyme required for sulfatase activity